MITDLRTYFDAQIKKVDPAIKPWERDVFGNNDLNQGQANKYYNLFFGISTLDRDGSGHFIVTPATVDLYTSTKRKIQESFDELYDKAIEIYKSIICPQDRNLANINDIEALSIEPIEEATNDKTIRMRITFNVRADFSF